MAGAFPGEDLNPPDRLALIVEMMREMSRQTDPQTMVQAYGARVRQLLPFDRFSAISRRGLSAPYYRITRSDLWKDTVNPWKEPHRLPTFAGGLLADLIYANQPRIINDLRVAPDDPAREYLADLRSLMAIPNFDQGEALNMVISGSLQPNAFDQERLPEIVWLSNLFGRATQNLVLNDQLQAAYAAVDHELKIVADIQRSLLPLSLPDIDSLDLAVDYQTSRRAGGDYYDFFPLPNDSWGILLADVSGHGTPAAVMMAITHSIAHAYPGPPLAPGEMLNFVNRKLAMVYTPQFDTFVTAFYGIYSPAARTLSYACAGHNPPRLRRVGGGIVGLEAVRNLPLGISAGERYEEAAVELSPGELVVLYTDGISEAANASGDQFGVAGLDAALGEPAGDARSFRDRVLAAVGKFSNGQPIEDDRTLLVAAAR